jgi:hypothetical protein
MEEKKSVFQTLNEINVNDKVEKKNNLSYLSWAWAWGEVKKKYPNAQYKIYERESEYGPINYFTDGCTAWVKTSVIIEGLEHIEELPVMDYKNKSITLYKLTSFDVNKAIQRSLTKAIARHGLGLYIYAGEDLPEEDKKNELEPKEETVKKFIAMQTEMNELGIDFREQYSDWVLNHSQCESQDLQKLNEPQLQSTIKAYGTLIKGYKEKIARA